MRRSDRVSCVQDRLGQRMSGVTLPVSRPVGRALIVGSESCRAAPLRLLQAMGFECETLPDPYQAMRHLCSRPKQPYTALILSLLSLYREELQIIPAVKQYLPHLEIWLTHIEQRPAALAEAMRLGADGLLGEDGLHRLAAPTAPEPRSRTLTGPPLPSVSSNPASGMKVIPILSESPPDDPSPTSSTPDAQEYDSSGPTHEPVLTAEELRALLQDQPDMPPAQGKD